jgi:hypothetical protein
MKNRKIATLLIIAKSALVPILADKLPPQPTIALTHGTYQSSQYFYIGTFIKTKELQKVKDDVTYSMGKIKSIAKVTTYFDLKMQGTYGIASQSSVYTVFRDQTASEGFLTTNYKDGNSGSVGIYRNLVEAVMPTFKGFRRYEYNDATSPGVVIDETGNPVYTATILSDNLISGSWDITWNIAPLNGAAPINITSKIQFIRSYGLLPGQLPPQTYERTLSQPGDGTVNSYKITDFTEK